jgi:predicted component of type VI protein secretion system
MSNLEKAARRLLHIVKGDGSNEMIELASGHWEPKIDAAILGLENALAQQAEPVVEPDETYKAVPLKAVRTGVVIWDKQAEPVAVQAEPVSTEPAASLMTNIQSGDVELVWNDDGFSKTMWRETILYKIGGGNGRP